MMDAPNAPIPDGDPQLDTALRGVTRFSPRQGFVDRVVGRVRVPLPHWARRLRDSWRGLVSGVTGWTILATFSAATAAAWGTAIAAGVRYGPLVTAEVVPWSIDEMARTAARSATQFVILGIPAADWSAAVQQQLAGAGLSLRALLAGYGLLVIVSAVALWRLMAEPARAKGPINVVR